MTVSSRIGYTVGITGIVGVLACGVLQLWLHMSRPGSDHDFLYFPTVLFAAVGWWGFHWAIPERAKGGGEWLIAARERIGFGRRASAGEIDLADEDPPKIEWVKGEKDGGVL